jgi:hypothetical protein
MGDDVSSDVTEEGRFLRTPLFPVCGVSAGIRVPQPSEAQAKALWRCHSIIWNQCIGADSTGGTPKHSVPSSCVVRNAASGQDA